MNLEFGSFKSIDKIDDMILDRMQVKKIYTMKVFTQLCLNFQFNIINLKICDVILFLFVLYEWNKNIKLLL